MFDKKVIRKCIIIILIIILILFGIKYIRRAFSRYESDGNSNANVDLAFWVVNEAFTSQSLSIGEIQPLPEREDVNRDEYVKKVEFTVQNYKEDANIVTNVPLRYDIQIRATTNMPLKYQLYQYGDDDILKTEPCVVSEQIIEDKDGTCYKEIKALSSSTNVNDFFFESVDKDNGKEKDRFILEIWLPYKVEEYDNDENFIFADLMEYIEFEINARQIVKTEEFE